MKKVLFSLVAVLLLSLSGIAQTTYTMVNSASQLEAGAQYILVGYDNDGQAYVMSYQKSNNRHAIAIDENGGVITTTVATDPSSQDEPFEFTLDGAPGAWTIFDALNNGYLCAPGGGNYLRTQTTLDDKGRWTITDGDEGGMVPVSNGGVEQCYMRYNITSTLFGCYKESSNVAAPVYFFKAGSAQIDPEPSNYPTEFMATVDGEDVYLFWEDATGAQLPFKYLVLASTGNITKPVDGTPVPDSDLAKNVAYGTMVAVFTGLQPNTTYHFAIFPYTNSGANIDYKNDGNYPTATITTENVEVLLFEDFDDGLGVFTEYNAYGEQVWHQGVYQGTTYANMNGYADGANHQNEDWLISPTINIPVNTYDEIQFEFRTAKKFDGPDLQVLVSMDYEGTGEPSDYTWLDITDAFDYSTGNYEWVESGVLIIEGDQLLPGHYHFAFKYTSTDQAAASWEIDYVKLIGKVTLSVDENDAQTISLYPNPASEQVSFELDNDAQVSVFDMTGRKVSEMNATAGNTQLNVSQLESGVYFINFRYANGSTAVAKFVKF